VALPTGTKQEAKGVSEIANDLWILCRDYAKQETIGPLKSVGRFLGWGMAGSFFLTLAVIFGALALLRALQTETDAFDGNLNWVPYLVAMLFVAAAVVLAITAVKRPMRAEEKQQA
jgi:Ca2+/Na+ antiporter